MTMGRAFFLNGNHEADHETHQTQDDEPHLKTFIKGESQADEDHEGHGKNHVDAFGEDGLDFSTSRVARMSRVPSRI